MLIALDGLLAAGLLLSTASQLRLSSLPVGPGEICLAIWVVIMLGREAARLGPPLTPALSRLLIFWSLFAVAQSLGILSGLAIGDRHDPQLFLHDVIAYPLLAAVSCLSVVGPGAGPRLHRTAWFVVTLGTLALAIQLANAGGLFATPLMDPWYWERLRGWSQNPNQLALLCIVLGLLSLHLADTAARPATRMAAIACAILPVWVGRLTKADTFSVVLLAAGPIFIVLKFRAWMCSAGPRLTFRTASAWIFILGLPVLLASAIPLGSSIAVQAGDFAKGMAKNGGKDTEREALLRLEIWRTAIRRGLEAGMLGLGPGPHLEIPQSLVAARQSEIEPKNVEHPEANSTPNFEAHNTLLDLFVQGGVLAVVSFVWLVTKSLFAAHRARSAGLTTLLLGLCIYGLPTLIIRHPTFWFAISLCLTAEAGILTAPRLAGRAGSVLDRAGLKRMSREPTMLLGGRHALGV
jgi:hypothetical protein